MLNGFRTWWIVAVALGAVVAGGTSAEASARCDRLLARLADRVLNAADTTCFESVDQDVRNPFNTSVLPSCGSGPALRLEKASYTDLTCASIATRPRECRPRSGLSDLPC